MKKLYFLALLIVAFTGNAQEEAFITKWVVSANTQITLPIVNNPDTNYTINFGDGTILYNQTGPVNHTYINQSIFPYIVTITGNFNQIDFSTVSIDKKSGLFQVVQWGNTEWVSMRNAFVRCINLNIIDPISPNLSQVTDMSRMFVGTDLSGSGDILNNWDVSNVTDMSYMFFNAQYFNRPIGNWDVSNVTNMSYMFQNAEYFNQPLSNWNVSNVTNMEGMFYNTEQFNQAIDSWDVGNVINMRSMFANARDFNQPLDNWNVGNVINMLGMFADADSFNQPLNNWNISGITSMDGMFSSADSFNGAINEWDVSNVTSMQGMFHYATSFNQPLNNWDVSNVTSMAQMFSHSPFNQNINNWNVSNVTSMLWMFYNSEQFNQPLNNWNVSNLINMQEMFYGATAFNQPLDNWNVSNVTSMGGLFSNATSFNQDISNWNFNQNVFISSGASFATSTFNSDNYDALLLKFIMLNLQNKLFNATDLKYCNVGMRNYLINNLGWTIHDSGLDPDCIGNNILGTVQFDENANGCDESDNKVSNFLVSASNGAFNYSGTTDNEGNYTTNVPEGNYLVELLNIPNYYTATPVTSQFTFTGVGNEQNINFCLTANEAINDLNITLLPITEARPGFEAQYQLIAENIGTQTITNTAVTLNFNEAMQTFISASPVPAATTANQLTFATGTIQPLQSKVINFTMQTFEPPVVNGNDVLDFTAVIIPDTADTTQQDNTYTLNQVVVNSYDPNDKRIIQGDEITMAQAEGYLDYIIRFQNTGTASAINIKVVDTLNPLLNWRTLKPISSSHNYTVKITDGNKAEFIFNNINLPHEAADGPGSNGYIAYKIKPVSTIQVGDIISSDASIYFDYNLPIITNMTTTEVITVLSSKTFGTGSRVMLYPNPASTIVYIKTEAGNTVNAVSVYNLQGRELLQYNSNPGHIDIDDLQTGVYLINLTTAQGTVSYRLIKK